MKTIFAALASAALLAAPMASISTPAAAQAHGGGGFHGGGGGFHGGGARGGGFRGGGFQGGGHGRGFRGGHDRDRDNGFFFFGLPYGDAFYDDDLYGYDGAYDDNAPSCGSWSWNAAQGRYDWIPC